MWSVLSQNGYIRLANSRTGNITDRTFATEGEAQQCADQWNAEMAEKLAENQRQAAVRKAERAAKGPLADQFTIDRKAH